MSRFNITINELPDDIHNNIICIQLWTNLKFDRAEDWTAQGQGWVLKFKGSLYKNDITYDDIIKRLQMEFQIINPGLYTIEQALSLYGKKATRFEDLQVNYQCDGYDIFITQ